MFKPAKMPIFAELPDAMVVDQQRGFDLAASSGRGDWTAGIKLVQLWGDPRFRDLMIITDVQRIRGAPEEVRHLVRTVAEADGYSTKQLFPRDPGQAEIDQADSYVMMLQGSRVAAVPHPVPRSCVRMRPRRRPISTGSACSRPAGTRR